jgi:Dyp-type peroxidase family
MQRDVIVRGRSLGGASDLTLLATIKPGFVESLESVTYKTRVKRVLETLHGARMASHEYAPARLLSDAVERVGMIHSVRVAVLEPEDKVLLAVTFDGSWESYIRVLWDKVGTLLDLIFCGTVDYVTAYDHTFDEWLGWARRVQVETGFFYGPPDATARDVLYQRRVERMRVRGAGGASGEQELNELRAVLPSAEESVQRLVKGVPALADDPPVAYPGDLRMVRERVRNGLQGLAALYRLTDLHRPSTPDGAVLRRAAIQLLMEFVQMRDALLIDTPLQEARSRFARQLDWLFPNEKAKAELVRPVPLAASARGKIEDAIRADIQGGILRAYDGTTHGLVLLLAFDDPAVAHAFLDALEGRITSDTELHDAAAGAVFRNLALTPAGLRAAGLGEDELELFPEEFRQGMAARAGLLGDVRNNHPGHWRLPRRYAGLDVAPPENETVELATVHAVLQLRCQARSPAEQAAVEYFEAHHPLREEVRLLKEAVPRLRILAVQSLRRNFRDQDGNPVVVEHFGYADGKGQPEVEPGPLRFNANRINLGEIVHGHDNAVDFARDPQDTTVPEPARARLRWLANGSFLVMRKYRQFASRLDKAVAAAAAAMAKELGGGPADYVEVAYGKLMGRARDGRPMAAPDLEPDRQNLFNYSDDPQGRLCPLHAHIRRAHPRQEPGDAGRAPRLLRRGMAYGPPRDAAEGDKDADRGLLFMAYNADLGQQFEVVQRWLTGGNSTGASSGQGCPIVGVPGNGASHHFRFEHDGRVFRVELEPLVQLFDQPQGFAQLEWGMYLFAPSLGVLRRLRDTAALRAAAAPAVPWRAERGDMLIANLLRLEAGAGPDAAREAWKAALEDPESVDRLDSASIWAAIRAHHGGILKTAYGTLVADRELVTRVLMNRDGLYSMRGQMARMERSFGNIYLGLDAGTDYEQQSGPINREIGNLKAEDVFNRARDAANEKINEIVAEARQKSVDVQDPRFEVGFEAREVVEHVVAVLCEEWFGLKDDGVHFRRGSTDWAWQEGRPPLYPGHFTAISRYMFQPNPGETAIALGQRYGQALRKAMNGFVASHVAYKTVPTGRDGKTPAPLSRAAFEHPTHGTDQDFVARNIVGVIMGFSPTTIGAVLNVLREWQRDGQFGALRAELAGAADYATADAIVAGAMAEAARMRPMPQLSWRTAAKAHRLGVPGAAEVEVAPGDPIVLGNVSGTQQSLADGREDGRLMFGGVRSAPHPTHACPGYAAGIGAMLGTLTALLAWDGTLRQGFAPLTFIAEGPSGWVPSRGERPAAPCAAPQAAEMLRRVLLARTRRTMAFTAAVQTGRILGWGDSWLDYRLASKDLPNLPIPIGTDLRDCLEKMKYQMPDKFCVWTDWTKIETMAANPSAFCTFLGTEMELRKPRAILLSGGGNDSTEAAMERLILPKGSAAPTRLDPQALGAHIARLQASYVTVLKAIDAEFGRQGRKLPVIVHGYDYPIPSGRFPKRWLSDPFERKGYDCSRASDVHEASVAMRELIDAFNQMQSGLKAVTGFDFVVHVNLSGTIEAAWPHNPTDGWANDLHPTDEGFALLAAKLDSAIQPLPMP